MVKHSTVNGAIMQVRLLSSEKNTNDLIVRCS